MTVFHVNHFHWLIIIVLHHIVNNMRSWANTVEGPTIRNSYPFISSYWYYSSILSSREAQKTGFHSFIRLHIDRVGFNSTDNLRLQLRNYKGGVRMAPIILLLIWTSQFFMLLTTCNDFYLYLIAAESHSNNFLSLHN